MELFAKLSMVLRDFQIPIQLFDDLITAFRKDALNTDYQEFDELLKYCKFSA
ncbi:MAG TPA: squalene synthase HpnC, partial [Bacteroidetes bacterium]|nr:squalene synthase HpnC [Bacteroidota bacterium]